MKANLVEFIQSLKENIETVVAISERTHYIFNSDDELSIGWAQLFDVVEIISQNATSIIIKIKYIDEE